MEAICPFLYQSREINVNVFCSRSLGCLVRISIVFIFPNITMMGLSQLVHGISPDSYSRSRVGHKIEVGPGKPKKRIYSALRRELVRNADFQALPQTYSDG